MPLFRSWVCGYAQCLKRVEMQVTDEEAKVLDVYSMQLPEGWVWHAYKSLRLPHLDSRMLGCCVEHARLASLPFVSPFEDA